MERKTIYVCKQCGSTNVQVMVWANPNTHHIFDDVQGVNENVWCEDCEDHTDLVEEFINGHG